MNEEARAELTMKNEFLFRTFFLMKKKRYGASIVLREGNIMIPFKEEIKGIDFIKASVSKNIAKRFTKIFCDYILFAEQMDPHGMVRALKEFQNEIDRSVRNGETIYLKRRKHIQNDWMKRQDSTSVLVGVDRSSVERWFGMNYIQNNASTISIVSN